MFESIFNGSPGIFSEIEDSRGFRFWIEAQVNFFGNIKVGLFGSNRHVDLVISSSQNISTISFLWKRKIIR